MSHAIRNFDRGVSSAWKSNFVTPEPQLSPNNQLVNNSTWQFPLSGYSSTSPPGTASSGSSPNSQCYGRSPDDLSVDSLINSLLQVVNSDDFGANPDLRLPSPGSYADTRCHDCTEVLCDSCTNSLHLNTLCSNDQQLMRPLTAEIPSPPMMHHHSPNAMMPLYCEVHRDAQRYYCQTCSKPFCADCGLHLHVGHVTVHLMDAIEGAGMQASQVLSEARVGMSKLRDELDTVQIAAESLEQKAREATSDVMMVIRRIASALEAREKELLSRIEKARLLKFTALKARDDGLRSGISRLSRAMDKLNDAMESSTLASNPFDLLVSKDMVSAELRMAQIFQMRQARQSLTQPEENWISFTGGEGNVLHAIANLGNIVVNNPGHIGDRRTVVRGRGGGSSSSSSNNSNSNNSNSNGSSGNGNANNGCSSPQRISPHFFYTNCPSPQTSSTSVNNLLSPMGPIPRGRPIPSSSYPVIVRTGRSGQQPNGLTKPIKVIGNDADARDNLCRPWGIACDKEGHIIVADRSNNRIQIYRQDGSFVRRFGTHGTAPGQFDRPAGVAVDGRKRIIVADKDNHRIQVLTMEGLFLLSFGEKGCRCGQFNYPWDVAANSDCQIVVSDTRNHRVQLFSPEGIFLRKYGYETTPSMWKHFDSPRGVSFNPEGNVVVTDFNNHRVIIIESDFLSARALDCETSTTNKQFLRPQGLVVDDEGNIIVADSRNHRIQIFDSTGSFKWKFGTHGKGLEEMDRPSGIALTPDGRIAVVDFGNNRVLLI